MSPVYSMRPLPYRAIWISDVHLGSRACKAEFLLKCSRVASLIGGYAYDFLVYLNRLVNHFRRRLGFPYWSLAAYLKARVKNAVNYISSFEEAISREVHKRKVDGLVCGHIHHAEIKHLNGALYCNDGDWVESCTALVETHEGCLHLLHWGDEKHAVKSVRAGVLDATASTA